MICLWQRLEYYEKICREFLSNVTYGDSIGQYSKSAGEALLQALNQLTKIREENEKNIADNSVNMDDIFCHLMEEGLSHAGRAR